MEGIDEYPYITKIKSMKHLGEFTEKHKRCLVMMGMEDCVACEMAMKHLLAAGEKYQKKLWLGYLDIAEVGISVSSVPLFQCFFNGYKIAALTERGYSLDALNDLMERLWLTKMKTGKTDE